MDNNCKIKVRGMVLEYAEGTPYSDIVADFAADVEGDIILVLVDGRLTELSKKVKEDCSIEFVTTSTKPGMSTYRRGIVLLMLRAFTRVFDAGQIRKITVEHTLGSALYCSLDANFKLTDDYIKEVKKEMDRIVAEDMPIKKRSIKTREARKMFAQAGMTDKEKLLRFRRVSNTNVYDLDGYTDYFYGYMPASAGLLKYYELALYGDGFIINLPDKSAPTVIPKFKDQPKFSAIHRASNEWGRMQGIETVGDLNEAIAKGNISDLILVQEAAQEHNIAKIAEMVKAREDTKFVMIAGPSSSGKTTFSHRLSIQLRTLGLKPHPIALDNYFKNREDTPLNEDGSYNFECLGAIDVEGFNKDMTDLLNGKEVDMRIFNFKSGRSEYRGNMLRLEKDDVLVLEGIHGLNDALSYSLPVDSKFKIYISALTQLNIDEHNRIPTTDGRLIRRMVRDARTRGTCARDTIAMWPSVRRGEEENIFPFQEEADVMFNSALIYELAVLKQSAEPLLFGISEDDPQYLEAKRLLKFLDYFIGVNSEEIPHNSIVREFVGGSVFPV
ncbi:MAG: nucleoside kinase [Lachnospiraceae bacterium]|nr:nucleoside kinase [Lachnospiraceae bacterium]